MTLGWWTLRSDYMARPLKPLVHGGGYYPSVRWTPLVYPGGYTTANGGGVEPEPVEKTVSGAIVHITDAIAAPLKALTVNVEPVQAGSGDPSPDNVRPISGRTSATVSRTGKNLLAPWVTSQVLNDVTWTANDDGTLLSNGTAAANASSQIITNLLLPSGSYVLSGCPAGGATSSYYLRVLLYNGTTLVDNSTDVGSGVAFSVTAEITSIRVFVSVNKGNDAPSGLWRPMIRKSSDTDSTYEPYAGNTYTIQLGDTVYGGTLDVTGGKMVVDSTRISVDGTNLYFAENSYFWNILPRGYPAPAESGIDVTSIGTPPGMWGVNVRNAQLFARKTEFTGVFSTVAEINDFCTNTPIDIVYKLATPIEITLTPTQIETLLGANNIWSDAGDVTVTYMAEGDASDAEALGILLGGRYTPSDDVTDKEALGIILGGT